MCLPNFVEFKQIEESSPLIGYRNWRLDIENPIILQSENQNYLWDKVIEGPHLVTDSNSGIYAYKNNNYKNNNYNNYNYYNYYKNNNYYNYYKNSYYKNSYYNYYNYYYYNYSLTGIISQYGRVAIHKIGQRSEYAKITKLFTIKESYANGPKEFLDWIDKFNLIILELSKRYECETIHWQDFKNG